MSQFFRRIIIASKIGWQLMNVGRKLGIL